MKYRLLPTLQERAQKIVLYQGFRAALYFFLAAGIFLYGALIHAYLRPQEIFFQLSSGRILAILLMPPLAACVWIVVRRWNNMPWFVHTLERSFPEWGDRLTTAVEVTQKAHGGNEPLSRIFASGLEEEVGSELGRMNWSKLCSLKGIAAPVLFVLLLTGTAGAHEVLQPGFFKTAYQLLAVSVPVSADSAAVSEEDGLFEIRVLPGSCEVILNAALTVQAEIVGAAASKVELYVREEGSMAWLIYPMQSEDERRFEFILGPVKKPLIYFVKADDRQSRTYQVRISGKLMPEAVIWEIQPPEYTKTPLQRRQGWFDKLTVPENSRVRVRFRFPRAVKAGWLTEDGHKTVILSRIADNEIEGAFNAVSGQMLTPEIEDIHGEKLRVLEPVWIQTVPDLPPFVEVLEPQMQNYVFATEEIPFKISVNDDYGLTAVTLVLQYKGETKRIEWLKSGDRHARELVLEPVLALEELPLESRDLVFGYLEVTDNYPGEPRQIARSPLFTFMVRDYVEQFKVNLPAAALPSLRSLFEDIIYEQTEITREVWDYLSLFETEKSFNETIPPRGDFR